MKIQMIGYADVSKHRIECLLRECLEFVFELNAITSVQNHNLFHSSSKADVILFGYSDMASVVEWLRIVPLSQNILLIFTGLIYHFENAGPLPANLKIHHLDLYSDTDQLISLIRQKQSRMEASYPDGDKTKV
jgi:hypothetical protein